MLFLCAMSKRIQHQYEFSFKAKEELLFSFVSSAINMATWFCDKVNEENGNIHFFWKDSNERAIMIKVVHRKSVTFKWIERSEDEFLRFDIEKDEITGTTLLIITEFDEEDQHEAGKQWWENTIQKLRRKLGG